MTMFNNGLLLVFVAVLAPSLGSQPAPNELPDELEQLLTDLIQAKSDFQSIFDISDQQCPCLTPGDPACFETDLENINSTLCDLIADLEALVADQPTECPALEGCAAVVTGNYTNVLAVVDPVGTILPSIVADEIVNELVIYGDNDTFYSIFYITNGDGFNVSELIFPGGSDTVLYTSPSGERGTGIATLDGSALFFSVDKGSPALVVIQGGSPGDLVNLTCAGTVRGYSGRIYFGDCNEIRSISANGGDQVDEVKFSMNINSFDVIDATQTVFCDEAGGLWIYNSATDCFKLVECNADLCTDVRINRCDSRVYVAYSGDNELGIFNVTSCESVGNLEYADQASDEPRVDFEPACF